MEGTRLDWTCLIVDALQTESPADSLALLSDLGLRVVVAKTSAETIVAIGLPIVAMVIITDAQGSGMAEPVRQFFQNRGCLPDRVCILSNQPSPYLLADAFEFGIETISTFSEAHTAVRQLCSDSLHLFREDGAEARITDIAKAIRAGEQSEIEKCLRHAEPLSAFDYRVCYQIGQAQEALGYFSSASQAYQDALGLNSQFRLAQSSMADSHMIMGKTNTALQILVKLTASNPGSGFLKAQMATVQAELGNTDLAKTLIEEAIALRGPVSKILEAQAQVMLAQGHMSDAFRLMDDMSEVGPFFAAKLNELGIKLSQAGKGKSALALYQKAHRIVRPELKYKISLNAALACRRLKLWPDALKYLGRCESEFGSSFPKLEKIRLSLLKSQDQDGLDTRTSREVG